MLRTRDIGLFAQLMLLLTSGQAVATQRPAPVLEHDGVRIVETAATPPCADANVDEGLWWAVLRTSQPSTAPPVMALAKDGSSPRVVGRVELVLYEVDEATDLVACSTSQVPHHDDRIVVVRAGDPLEIEVDPDPEPNPDDPRNPGDKAGDPLEIEVDPDP